MARVISRQDRSDFQARPAQAPAPSSKKAVSFSSARNNEALAVAMRVNCEVRVLARQPKGRINSLCNPARFKNRRSEQKSGLGDHTGEDNRGEVAMFGAGAQGSNPIFSSKAGNRGSARNSFKPAQMQYSRRYAMLPFSCSMPRAKQPKVSSRLPKLA